MEHLVLAGFTNKQSITELMTVTIKMLANCAGQSKTKLVQQMISTHRKIFYDMQNPGVDFF